MRRTIRIGPETGPPGQAHRALSPPSGPPPPPAVAPAASCPVEPGSGHAVAPATARLGLRVVGLDPGLADTGYAVLERRPGRPAVLDTGVIRTAAGEPLDGRLERLYEGTRSVLDRFTPDLLVVEDVFGAPGRPRAAILTGHARAVICLAGRQRKIELITVTPAEVKRAVTASGAASKGQVARAVQALLSLAGLPRPSHVADALALAFTGLQRASGAGRPGSG